MRLGQSSFSGSWDPRSNGFRVVRPRRKSIGGSNRQVFFERLEDRVVLSHEGLTAAELAAIEFAMQVNGLGPIQTEFLKDGTAVEQHPPVYSGQDWVVQTDGSINGADLDAVLTEVTNSFTFAFLNDTFLLDTTVSLLEIEAFHQSISTTPGVLIAYPVLSFPEIQPQFLPMDQFFPEQWHLRNIGQFGGTPGEDLNVETAWDMFTGAGVVVAVVDEGVQYTHQDLNDNYDQANDFDYSFLDPDPLPNAAGGEGHGTAVGGLIAAEVNNEMSMNEGVAGVAFDATLIGLRIFAPGFAGDANVAMALSHMPGLVNVYNNSWGFLGGAISNNVLPLVRGAIIAGGANGEIYVFSGGNNRGFDGNVNYDETKTSRFVIPVAALNDDGNFSSYSSPGAPLIISAYGSECIAPRAIVTTGLLGADSGSDGGNHPADNDYSNGFCGTSAAAPEVTGVVALMLEANPALTVRDIRKILALTARVNDPTDPDWIMNGGGHMVNHNYGFGAVDAAAAVAMAATWPGLSPETAFLSGPIPVNQPIPDLGQVITTFDVTAAINIEHVDVVLNAQHTFRGDLEIVLVSPQGTRSVLAEARFSDGGNDYTNWVFSSARHLDEFSVGTWTLMIVDRQAIDQGTILSWELNIFGEPITDVEVQEFTTTAGMPGQLEISYEILLADAMPFELAFFQSLDAVINIGDVEVAPRMMVSNAADLTIGVHTITIPAPQAMAHRTALEDISNVPFFLVVADPDNTLLESSDTNNDLNFVGVFHDDFAGAAPFVLRGRDDTDRRVTDDPNDVVDLTGGATELTISGTLVTAPLLIPNVDITEVRFLGVGGDDSLRMLNIPAMPIVGLGGTGNDSFDTSGWNGPGAITLDGQAGTDTIIDANDVDYTLSDAMLLRSGLAAVPLVSIEAAVLTGGPGNNTFIVQNWTGTADLNGGDGGDTYSFTLGVPIGIVRIMDSGTTGNDLLLINGTPNPDTIAVAASMAVLPQGTLQYTGLEQLIVDGMGETDSINLDSTAANVAVTVNGGAGDDVISICGTSRDLDGLLSDPIINGGAGVNRLLVDDSANTTAGTYTVTSTFVTRNPTIFYSMFQQVVVIGGIVADIFNVTPSTTVEFTINGNLPPPLSPNGDQLIVDFSAVFGRNLEIFSPGTGRWTFQSGHLPINFISIEGFNGVDRIAVATDAGRDTLPLVKVFDVEGRVLFQFLAYEPDFRGGIRIATGDVNLDGIPDIVTVPTRCSEALVRLFNGLNGALIDEFPALYPFYTLGGAPAVGDVNGDGINDIVISALRGPSVVQVFTGPGFSRERSFLAFDEDFIGGATVAVGDINSDGRGDIIVGSGSGMESVVRVFDFTTLNVLREFMPYDATYRGGVAVAAGDYTGDGIDDIITAQQRRGEGLVRVFDGASGALVTSFQAFNSPRYAPVFVAVSENIAGGPTVDIVAAQGSDGRIREVRRFRDTNGDGQPDFFNPLLRNDPDLLSGFAVG
jgi:subtilisin family serine protease